VDIGTRAKLARRFLFCFSASWAVTAFAWPGPVEGLRILYSALIGLGLAALILKYYDRFTSDMAADLFYRSGGEAKVGYSREKALALQGDREGACAALRERHRENRDPEALRSMLAIAVQRPQLDRWASTACQGLLRDPSTIEEDRQTYRQILSTLGSSEPFQGMR
jgi:hypothetical protein